jgi:hypothetical protein
MRGSVSRLSRHVTLCTRGKREDGRGLEGSFEVDLLRQRMGKKTVWAVESRVKLLEVD